VRLAHNPDYAQGLATSLKTGLAAVPAEAAGALVMLGDMPAVTRVEIGRLLDAFASRDGPAIVLPTVRGKRGNPVLWGREFFSELMTVAGDSGARHILARHEDAVRRIEIGEAAEIDIDTPEALAAAGGAPPDASGIAESAS
jgi:molybdenum cofactor cytidylyltransferase